MDCIVHRSSKKANTYLYVRSDLPLDDLPVALLDAFGEPEPFLELSLSPGRPLAQADVRQVIADLETQGYYLQLPPEERPGDDA